MVCSWGIDLQPPADMFHFLHSLCASLILWVCCAIARATWVDEWWCPLVNKAPSPTLMCHRHKEPASWTSYSPLTHFPHSSSYLLTLLLLAQSPSLTRSTSLSSLLHPSCSWLFFIATAPQRRAGWDHISSPFVLSFLRKMEQRDEWVGNAEL